MATDSVAATPPTPTPAGARRTHYWQLPAFLAGVAAVALAVAKFPVAPDTPTARHQRNVKTLKLALEAKSLDAPAVESLAATVAADPAADAAAKLLAGTALVAVAEQSPPRTGPDDAPDADAWRRAAAQLAAVEAGGLASADDRKRLAFRQAKAQAALAAGDAKLLALTLADVPPGEEIEGERRRLLAECYLRQAPPDPKHAREELQAYLSSSLRLHPATAARAKHKLAGVHLSLNDRDKARACLKEIGPTAPADVQALAKAQLGRLAAAENQYAEAVAEFEAALANPALPTADREGVTYELGCNLLGAKKPAAAVPHLEAAAKGAGPQAASAGVLLAHVLLADPAGRGRRAPAIDALATAAKVPTLAGVADGPPRDENSTLLKDARAAFEEAIATCVSEGDFASAVRAATEYSPVARPGRATEKRAEANAAWGTSLKADPATLPAAAQKLADAAADFAALAATFPTPAGKADLMKRAAQCHRAAGDDKAAAALIDQLTQTPGVSDDVIATAFVEKADGLLAGSQFDDGVKALRQAMARPTPAAATARVKLAIAHIEQARGRHKAATTEAAKQEVQGMMQLGRDLLAAAVNATGESAVEKDAQQLALFEMGKLHLNQMDLSEAETRFRQLLQSHPTGAQAGQGKLYLASCLLLMARGDHQGGRPPADADAKLTEARKLFEALSESTDPFLRTQADIRLANATLLLRKYDEMPALCDKLAKRYEGKVEELIIRSMLYTAYHFADRLEPAAGVRVQMQELFHKLPDSAFPGGADEYTREYWQREWFAPLKAK